MNDSSFAIISKELNKLIGCIGVMRGNRGNIGIPDDELEFGYWIGVPHWKQGYATEASMCMIAYAFDILHVNKVWAGHFDGNVQSSRVIEKCGLQFDHTVKDTYWALLDKKLTEHNYVVTKEEWEKRK